MHALKATLETGHAGTGKLVVVHGGAGGTGSFAIQLAKMAGAQVACTCSDANSDYVRSLGADHVIDYRRVNVVDAIRAWAPDGVDLIVDTVGQGTFVETISTMKSGGIICPIGTLIADETPYDAEQATKVGVTIIPTISDFESQPVQLAGLVAALSDGRIRAPETRTMPLSEAGEAQRLVQQGHVRGKIILDINASLEG